MKAAILIFSILFVPYVLCQGHYVPAYVWIPNLNSSNNYSGVAPPAWNKTNYNNFNSTKGYNNNNHSTFNTTGYNGTQDGHLFLGTIQPFDRQLFSQEYFKPSRWWGNREKIIEYPKDLPAGYNRHEIITAVRIFNRFYDGNTARASILKGGIGSQYVKIKLESKWGKGFNFLVQLYGH